MGLESLAIIPILSLLMIVHELGHFITARRAGVVVQEFAIGFPPRLFSIKHDGIVYSLNLVPLGAYVKMLGEEDPSAPGSFARQPGWVRAIILGAGASMNFLLAVLLFAAAFMVGFPAPAREQVTIMEIQPGSPAESAGLQSGDIVRRINGIPVDLTSTFIDTTRANLGRPVTLAVERAGSEIEVTLTPRTVVPEGQGPIGVRIQTTVLETKIVNHPPLASLGMGLERSWDVVRYTLMTPVLLMEGVVQPEEVRPVGPFGIAQVTSQAASYVADTGFWYPVLTVTAMLSAGLAVANMLPFPALDGGRIVFVVLEALRGGRRVSPQREGMVHFVGIIVLVAIMLAVTFYDVTSPLPQINWGPR